MRTVLDNCLKPAVLLLFLMAAGLAHADIWTDAEHGYADNDGTKIHYATAGQGPLVVMIHGFPDFWDSWRHQMEGLSDYFQVVAVDQRGYNLSDKPAGDENYDMSLLTADIAAVIRHLGQDINPEQRANSGYAQRFQQGKPSDPDIMFGGPMTPQTLAGWVRDPVVRQRYVEAFAQSDFDAMIAYYKRNYPPLPEYSETPPPYTAPRLNVPLLVFHGLDDTALHSDGLNNTWDWNDAATTIMAVPGAGHFVQQDAAETVTNTLRWWLQANR